MALLVLDSRCHLLKSLLSFIVKLLIMIIRLLFKLSLNKLILNFLLSRSLELSYMCKCRCFELELSGDLLLFSWHSDSDSREPFSLELLWPTPILHLSDFVGEIGSQIIHWRCLLGSLGLDFLVLELPFILDTFYLVIDVLFSEHFSHGFKTVFD